MTGGMAQQLFNKQRHEGLGQHPEISATYRQSGHSNWYAQFGVFSPVNLDALACSLTHYDDVGNAADDQEISCEGTGKSKHGSGMFAHCCRQKQHDCRHVRNDVADGEIHAK